MGFINANGSHTQAKAITFVTDLNWYSMGNFTGDSFTYGGPGQYRNLPICQFLLH